MSMTGRSVLLSAAAITALAAPEARAEITAPVRPWEGFASPVGIGFDTGGNLYGAEWNAGRVFVVDYGGTTVRKILMEGSSRIVADALSSPVGLVLSPDGAALLTATWGDGTICRIALPS